MMLEGTHHSEEAKKKMSETRKGENNSFYGKQHSKETKQKMSLIRKGTHPSEETKKKISKAQKNMSKEAKEKMSKTRKGKMPINKQRPGEWMNIKRGYFNINGIEMFFRSKWEANYTLYLNFLIKQKQILKWEYEADVFIFEKIKFGTRSYRPDFKIYNNDKSIEYHEVKGWMTPKSKTKIKRMAKYYPNIKLIIIDKDVYVDIKKKLGKMLKFY